MKHFVRSVCMVLVLSLFLAVPVGANAAVEPRGSMYFMLYQVCIYKTGGNNYQASFDVTGTNTMLELGAKSLSIQQSADGENWTTIRTYTSEYYPQMIGENVLTYDWYFNRTAESGYYYRLKVVLWAKNSSGTGQMTVYSTAVWFG